MYLSSVIIILNLVINPIYGCRSNVPPPTPIPTPTNSVTTIKPPLHTPLLCKSGCTMDINNGLPDPEPLLLVPGSTELLYPNVTDGKIHMKCGETVELFCTLGLEKWKNKTMNATCDDGNLFYYGKTAQSLFEFKRFNCSHCVGDECNTLPNHVVKRTTRICSENLTFIEIGFEVENRFIRIMDICHNESLVSTLYVQYKMNPSSEQQNIGMPPNEEIFHENQNIEHFYKRNVQRRTIGIILNSTRKADWLIPIMNYSYFLEGQLASTKDFIYGAQQFSTFYFLNVAPQWTSYNDGNWMKVTNGVRKFVNDRNLIVDIYSGTHGVISFANETGVKNEIYLNVTKTFKSLPIPKLFYKIIVHPQTSSGIAFITTNNPNATLAEIQSDYIYCMDVSDVIQWMKWNQSDIGQGYSYACRVSDFVYAIKQLSQLSHISRLLL